MRLTCLKFKDSRRLKKPVSLKSIVIISFFGFIFLLGFSPLILAAFEVGNPDYLISKTYGSNFSITGWINISFEYESSDSIFAASFDSEAETSMSLKEILELNPGYNYMCTPIDCEKDYSENNPQTTKNFNIGSGESKIIGLVFEGEVISVDSIKFVLESTAGSSCQSQLEIDILDDGKINLLNSNVGTGVCSGLKSYGCFDDSEDTTEFVFEAAGSFCQRINLSESPGFRIGAWIKRVGGSSTVNASLYDLNGLKKGSCTLPPVTSTSGKEYYCDLDYLVTESKEYYVCISALEGDADYRIKGYTDPEPLCGFPYLPTGEATAAYWIFVEGKEFANFGSLNAGPTLPNGEYLSNIIYEYLVQRYGISSGKTDCSTGCIVPIKILSSLEQEASLKSLESRYHTDAGIREDHRFYDVTESSARITSDNSQKIYLDLAEFNVPEETGEYTFRLNLNSEEIFSEEIEVKDVPIIQSIDPLLTTTGFPITFEVKVTLPNDVSVEDYEWEFFDTVGNVTRTETTTINKVVHIYSETGTYNLRVSATDFKGMSSSKTFEINVTSPKELIRTNLDKIDKNIERINSFTSGLPLFQKSSINSVLRIENISSQLKRLEQEYNAAITPEENLAELNNIIEELVEIKLPNTIFKSVQADSSLFFPELGFIDVDVIQTVAGGNYTGSNEENYKKAISEWQLKNLNVIFDFNKFSADYNTGTEPLVSILELKTEEKSDLTYDYFVFVPVLEGIGFDKSMQQESGFYYTVLGDNSVSRISFYTTEDLDFIELPVFISPSISRLSVAEPSITEKKPKMIIFILVLALLAILGIAAYILLFQWYKKKYEGYLFPHRNDLYNVVHYINRSKNKGLTNKQIIRNLKKANWNSEQIRYVMRRYEGKRTGMVEIPITKLIKKIEKEKMKEQEQRHGGPTGYHRPRHRRY